jgi:hypothetical protein
MITGERIVGKFFHQGGGRPSSLTETLRVTKTPGAPLSGNTPRECPSWGGGGDQ